MVYNNNSYIRFVACNEPDDDNNVPLIIDQAYHHPKITQIL